MSKSNPIKPPPKNYKIGVKRCKDFGYWTKNDAANIIMTTEYTEASKIQPTCPISHNMTYNLNLLKPRVIEKGTKIFIIDQK